jgi:predicted methyltransferase
MSEVSNVFEHFESYLCAEDAAVYHPQKLQPFHFNPERKTKLYCGDALSILKRVPDRCIDIIFADPPYFGNQSGLIIKRDL